MSSDGAAWAPATTKLTVNLLSDNVGVHEDGDFGLLAEVGNEAIAVIWHEANGTITFFSSANAGVDWTDEAIDISSGNGPQGVAHYADIDGIEKLYVGTREGLYIVDTSAATWTTELIYPMAPHASNCKRMTVHNGALYFAHGVDNDSPMPMTKMEVRGDARVFTEGLGLNTEDGVPSDMLGPCRWMKSVGDQLFVSVGGGAASRQARILAYIERGGVPTWHSMLKHDTANEKIEWLDFSGDDDGTPRLHYAVRTATATSTASFLAQPLTNPQSGVTIKRQTTGYIISAYLDYGMPTTDGAMLQVEITSTGLGAATTNNYVNVDYGVNGAARTTDLGDYLSSTSALVWASGAGVQAKNVGLTINLLQDDGDTTTSPEVHSVSIVANKHVEVREGWRLKVDLDKTARHYRTQPEVIITRLKTARDLKTLPAFEYGPSGTKYVEVLPKWRWNLKPRRRSAHGAHVSGDNLKQRGGTVELTVGEVVG